MKYTLVTQSFGRESEYRRVILTIWSLWSWSEHQNPVILFTDQPSYFENYFVGMPIRYVLLTPAKMKMMRGDIDFLHHMKIALLEEAFGMTESALLYADSDTFFIADPTTLLVQLAPERAFMHCREYAFEEVRNMPLPAGKTFRDFVALIERQPFTLANRSSLFVKTTQHSWNAGVMMFHPLHVRLLPDVYALTNQFYPATQNHASEQYAFSIVLQNNTDLRACEEVIYHYWYRIKKQVIDIFLETRITTEWGHEPSLNKMKTVKKWVQLLPNLLDNHVLALRDNAIQSFHERKYWKGYQFALRKIWKDPLEGLFYKDLLYHTKRMLLRSHG